LKVPIFLRAIGPTRGHEVGRERAPKSARRVATFQATVSVEWFMKKMPTVAARRG